MNKKQKALIIALIVGILICIGITLWAVFFRGNDDGPISPDYPPQGTEDNQKPIDGDDSTKIDSPEGGGAMRVTYGTTATASRSKGKVTLYYANPNASNQNVRIFIIITNKNTGEQIYVASSELIEPGNYVTELTFNSEAKKLLGIGGYNAELLVQSFSSDNEKSMVEAKGELTVNVVE